MQKGFIDVILSFLWRFFITVAHHLLLFILGPLTTTHPGFCIKYSRMIYFWVCLGQTRQRAGIREYGEYGAPVTIDDGRDKMLTTWRWKRLITGIIGSLPVTLKGDVNLNVPPDFQTSLGVSPLKVHSKSNLDLRRAPRLLIIFYILQAMIYSPMYNDKVNNILRPT